MIPSFAEYVVFVIGATVLGLAVGLAAGALFYARRRRRPPK